MLSALPAIQPVSNKNLSRMASGYGPRIHPIYKTRKMHSGMDFSAKSGTPIYATGDGKVSKVRRSRRGYGNHVIINHGYGYKTLYAHMKKYAVKKGQKVKRGEVIGYVGSTDRPFTWAKSSFIMSGCVGAMVPAGLGSFCECASAITRSVCLRSDEQSLI